MMAGFLSTPAFGVLILGLFGAVLGCVAWIGVADTAKRYPNLKGPFRGPLFDALPYNTQRSMAGAFMCLMFFVYGLIRFILLKR